MFALPDQHTYEEAQLALFDSQQANDKLRAQVRDLQNQLARSQANVSALESQVGDLQAELDHFWDVDKGSLWKSGFTSRTQSHRDSSTTRDGEESMHPTDS